jgi:lipoyl(octanoyl) transferase
MEIQNLGLINYADALEIQMLSVDAVINSNDKSFLPEKIILCEHPLVITVGRALDSIKEIFVKEDVIPIHHVSRGGRATLHLPGQIVCYPIVSLESRGRDLHGFMRLLEEAIIETLADFRIEATRLEGKMGDLPRFIVKC